MTVAALLIANRGEIAVRIARAAADLGLRTVAAYSEDDASIAAAKATGCDAVHPGYGFLAERSDFARRCAEAGIAFVGPSVEHLDLFGDKARARATCSGPYATAGPCWRSSHW